MSGSTSSSRGVPFLLLVLAAGILLFSAAPAVALDEEECYRCHGLTGFTVRAGDNLALRARPHRGDAPRLLLLGHLDTVPVSDENPARLEGERLYGLGASDMKGADALILHLLEASLGREPRYDIDAVL